MERILIVVNPASNKGNNRRLIPKINSFFSEQHIDCHIAQTIQPGEAENLAHNARKNGFDLVIAAGGDGTINEVANGILTDLNLPSKQLPLGILPIGQGNDFAFGAGIPLDLDQSLATIIHGKVIEIDTGWVAGGCYPNGRYFVNGLGIGFGALATFEAARHKKISGFFSYFVSIIKTFLSNFHVPKIRSVFDGTTIEFWCLECSIMNGRRLGGGFYIAPLADVKDGVFNICLVNKISRFEMVFSALPRFLLGTQDSMKAVQNLQSTTFSISALTGYLPAHIDGEKLSKTSDFLHGKIIPSALQLIV